MTIFDNPGTNQSFMNKSPSPKFYRVQKDTHCIKNITMYANIDCKSMHFATQTNDNIWLNLYGDLRRKVADLTKYREKTILFRFPI